MTDQTKQKLGYWFFGLFTGGAITAPITAFITKRIYDKKAAKLAETVVVTGSSEGVTNRQQEETKETPTEPDDIPDEEDINNYNIDIDDEEATEEARERTEEHERYLDMIDKYTDTLAVPFTIDAEEFMNSHYMQKAYINWYERDNVFEEDLGVIDDPFLSFGVTDGHELFKDADLRFDPDIVYLRNEKQTTDYEISRVHGSYAERVGGERSLGETDTYGGVN